MLRGDGEAGLGGRCASRTPIALATALIALAFTAATAYGASTRAEYDDQVNPICQSANTQAEQLYESIEQLSRKVDGTRVTGKKARLLRKRLDRLYDQFPFLWLAIYQAEFDQLKAVPPAPGDESLASDWLGNRGQILAKELELFQLFENEDKVFNSGPKLPKHPSRRAIKRWLKRQHRVAKRLHRQETLLYNQLETAYKLDLELGTRIGATYCVTGATGSILIVGSSN